MSLHYFNTLLYVEVFSSFDTQTSMSTRRSTSQASSQTYLTISQRHIVLLLCDQSLSLLRGECDTSDCRALYVEQSHIKLCICVSLPAAFPLLRRLAKAILLNLILQQDITITLTYTMIVIKPDLARDLRRGTEDFGPLCDGKWQGDLMQRHKGDRGIHDQHSKEPPFSCSIVACIPQLHGTPSSPCRMLTWAQKASTKNSAH